MGCINWVGGSPGIARVRAAVALSRRGVLDHGYDTIYAVQDIEDDALAGIGSTARAFGEHLRLGIGSLYALAVICLEAALHAAGAGSPAQGGLLLFALHLAWQTMRVDPNNGALALRLFRSNRDAGLMLFAGLAADIFLAPK